jgi:hypothetical protein
MDNDSWVTDPVDGVVASVQNLHIKQDSSPHDSMSSNNDVSPTMRAIICRHHSIGTQWSCEIGNLRHAGSVYEIALCLRELSQFLDEIDRIDRLKYCKADFESALTDLRISGIFLTDKVFQSIAAISKKYFDECYIDCIPEVLMQEIFMMIPVEEFSTIASTCKEWKALWRSDIIWKTQYKLRFLPLNPNSMPTTALCPFYNLFEDRLAQPYIGDHIEVSWRGKFRLEANDIYQGLAWWVGVVVGCSASTSEEHGTDTEYDAACHGHRSAITKYKIHYPGWESRWDEWVDRERLRWPMKLDNASSAKICKGDTVELWCCGFNVPGAWLESVVKRIKKGRYCVTRAHVSGSIWVPRERIRPQKRKVNLLIETPSVDIVSTSPVNCHPQCCIM